MSEPHLIASIPKNARERVRIELTEFKGHQLLQVRVWVGKDDGSAIPTKSGFGLRVAMIPALRAAIVQAEAKAREVGLLEEA